MATFTHFQETLRSLLSGVWGMFQEARRAEGPFFQNLASRITSVDDMRDKLLLQELQMKEGMQRIEVLRNEHEYELSLLAHDINNTAQNLISNSDTVFEQLESLEFAHDVSDAKIRLKRVVAIARRLATLATDVRQKHELGTLQDLSPREVVSVSQVLKGAIDFVKFSAEQKNITFINSLEEEELCSRISAHEHLEVLLRNILRAAVFNSPAQAQVDVRLRGDSSWVYVEIGDRGPGLSAKNQKILFDLGREGVQVRQILGGLGESLLEFRRLVESAYGVFEVRSDGAKKGVTFHMAFPRVFSKTTHLAGASWVLLVDDKPELTSFYARVANALSFESIVAASVTEAIEVVSKQGEPMFVLTDLRLGESDGLELVRFLREQYGDMLPILVVSGEDEEDVEERVKQAGATEFLSKPIGRQKLFGQIQKLLGGKEVIEGKGL